MKYMLDTNIIAYAKNNRPESVLKGTSKNSHHRVEDLPVQERAGL